MGSPTRIDYRKKGTRILTSPLEDLVQKPSAPLCFAALLVEMLLSMAIRTFAGVQKAGALFCSQVDSSSMCVGVAFLLVLFIVGCKYPSLLAKIPRDGKVSLLVVKGRFFLVNQPELKMARWQIGS